MSRWWLTTRTSALAAAPPRRVEEALGVVRAAGAQAVVVLRHHLLPDLRARALRQVGQAAVAGLLRPLEDVPQLRRQLVLEQRRLRLHLRRLALAEVVAAPLDEGGRALEAGPLDEEGQVLADQLLLQVDGVRRDDHPLAVGLRPQDRGHQIGERLAGAGARLDGQHVAPVEGAGDRVEHLELLQAVLVAGQRGGDGPLRSEGLQGLLAIDGLLGRSRPEARRRRRRARRRCRRCTSRRPRCRAPRRPGCRRRKGAAARRDGCE